LIKQNEELKQELEDKKIQKQKEIDDDENIIQEDNNLDAENKKLKQEISDLKIIIEKLNKEKDDNKIEMKKIKEQNDNLISDFNKTKEISKIQLCDSLEENKKLNEKNNILLSNNEELKKENEIFKQKNKDFILKYELLEKNFNDIKIKFDDIQNNDPLKLYVVPTLIGLNNIGATCFMNSTLQCLSQTKDLTNFFLKQKYLEKSGNNNISLNDKSNYRLYSSFLELIQKLWDKNGPKSYSPTEFMNLVNEMNPLFKTGQAGDAKDFIIFVLEQLHKELSKSVKSNNIINLEPLNQYDKNNSLNYFLKDFKSQISIISDIFYGFNETTNECLNCKNIYNCKKLNKLNNPICYNYGIFNCLIFPLEDVKNFKNNNNNNCVSIYDCFQYNQKTELFTGENKNYCNMCKQLFDSNYTSKIYKCPTVLILILDRGKGNIYNIKLIFEEFIDVTDFVLQKEKSKIIYNL